MESRCTSNLATDLGRIGYGDALSLQKHLLDLVRTGQFPGFIIFLEHYPVYTIGRKFSRENFPGIDAVETERGGDITYHGPGQMVFYPVLRIDQGRGPDVRSFVKIVENSVIEALKQFGIESHVGDEPGIWIESGKHSRKVASIGMAIDHGVSYHGVSVNTSPEVLEGFGRIRPCGLDPAVMGYVKIDGVKFRGAVIEAFAKHFGTFRFSVKEDFLKEVGYQL